MNNILFTLFTLATCVQVHASQIARVQHAEEKILHDEITLEFIEAVKSKDLQKVEQFLTAEEKPNINALFDYHNYAGNHLLSTVQYTPLMYAADWLNVPMVNLLLSRGALCDIKNKNGDTALYLLVEGYRIFHFLNKKHDDVAREKEHRRCLAKTKAILQSLTQARARLNASEHSVLRYAAVHRVAKVIEFLLYNAYADINEKDGRGKTINDWIKDRDLLPDEWILRQEDTSGKVVAKYRHYQERSKLYTQEVADAMEAISYGSSGGDSIATLISEYAHHPADIRAIEGAEDQMEDVLEQDEPQRSWCTIS